MLAALTQRGRLRHAHVGTAPTARLRAVEEVAVVVVVLVVAAAGLSALARVVGVPYPILLVVGGLALGLIPGAPQLELAPDVVFLLFLPRCCTTRRTSRRCGTCAPTRGRSRCWPSGWCWSPWRWWPQRRACWSRDFPGRWRSRSGRPSRRPDPVAATAIMRPAAHRRPRRGGRAGGRLAAGVVPPAGGRHPRGEHAVAGDGVGRVPVGRAAGRLRGPRRGQRGPVHRLAGPVAGLRGDPSGRAVGVEDGRLPRQRRAVHPRRPAAAG